MLFLNSLARRIHEEHHIDVRTVVCIIACIRSEQNHINITYNIYVHLYGDGFDEMYEALMGK